MVLTLPGMGMESQKVKYLQWLHTAQMLTRKIIRGEVERTYRGDERARQYRRVRGDIDSVAPLISWEVDAWS